MKKLAILFLVALSCESVSVRGSGPEQRLADERVNVVADGELSKRTTQFLYRHDLSTVEDVDAFLRKERNRNAAFHLAEMLFREAGKKKDRTHYIAAAFFAERYAFDPDLGPRPSMYDPLFRWAVDIYNLSLADFGPWLIDKQNHTAKLLGRTFSCECPPSKARYKLATDYEPDGLDRFSRAYGLGLPLIAEQTDERGYTMAYARTMLVDVHGSAVKQGVVKVVAKIYDPSTQPTVLTKDLEIPLEADYSTPIAYFLQRAPKVSGMTAMIHTERYLEEGGLYMMAPYDRSKIPVVFVHGLMADMKRWSRMINDLSAEPELRKRFQFWLFSYPTGLPIPYSAMGLRRALNTVHKKHGFDDMVIIGHSMGGLLTRACVLSSGDRITKLYTKTPFEQWKLPKDTKVLLGDALRWERLPYVHRVVFMATLHRGAPMATSLIGDLGELLIDLPDSVQKAHEDIDAFLEKDPGATGVLPGGMLISGVGGLEAKNPIQKEISTWPFKGVIVHSVIGNEKELKAGGTDGLVPYTSSHLDVAASEKIVKSKHKNVPSVSGSVAEVRRILFQHLK